MTVCPQAECAHVPVLAREVVELLRPRTGGLYLDATVGAGGHSRLILEASAPEGRVIACDRDERAISAASKTLSGFEDRVELIREDFRRVRDFLGDRELDGALADLGASSLQLDDAEAGFSFRLAGPLDMRMDQRQRTTAADLANSLPERKLADILWRYGEERRSRRIAAAIVAVRRRAPIRRTDELARILRSVLGRGKGRIDPATRTFQALRIAVNEELEGLDGFIRDVVGCLVSGGRLVVISFHSLEDRIVKQTFRELAGRAPTADGIPESREPLPTARLLTRRPLRPSENEKKGNPRSRSARLRAVEKLEDV